MLSCIQQEWQWDTTTATSFAPTALVFILLIYIAIFFIYLLIIYPVLYGTEKALPQPAWGSAFSYPLRQRIRVASSPKGRAIGSPGSPLLNAECFQTP